MSGRSHGARQREKARRAALAQGFDAPRPVPLARFEVDGTDLRARLVEAGILVPATGPLRRLRLPLGERVLRLDDAGRAVARARVAQWLALPPAERERWAMRQHHEAR